MFLEKPLKSRSQSEKEFCSKEAYFLLIVPHQMSLDQEADSDTSTFPKQIKNIAWVTSNYSWNQEYLYKEYLYSVGKKDKICFQKWCYSKRVCQNLKVIVNYWRQS